ncbi:MAG: hypothetical protein E7425_07810 [Ruminococcaceae bacterium]|nr:hypothetical protein [Oscillospiraceae bacterium]
MGDMYQDTVTVAECIELCAETVKKESGQTDDDLVAINIERAYLSICTYLWCDELPRRLVSAVGALAPTLICFSDRSTNGYVTQQTQGSRSVSYGYGKGAELDEYGLTAAVRAMLPPPRLRVF